MINIDIVTEEIHKYFLYHAYVAASECSDDPMTKVGAIITIKEKDKYRMITRAANVLPRTIEGTQTELADKLSDRVWKNEVISHAEKTAILRAKMLGLEVAGSRMYLNWVPCYGCAREIIDSGISEIVGHKAMIDKTPEKWWDSTNKAIEELKKNNIKCSMYDGTIGGVVSTFNGQIWFP